MGHIFRESHFYKKYSLSSAVLEEGDGFKVKTMHDAFSADNFIPGELHTHDFYTVIWFKTGGGTHTVDFNIYDVTPNTVFFLAPGMIHSFNSPTDQEGYIVEFSADFISDERQQESVFLKYGTFYAENPCHRISETDSRFLEHIVEAMYNESGRRGQFAHGLYLGMLVNLFLITLHRAEPDSAAQFPNLVSPSTRTFIRFRQAVENNFQKYHEVKAYSKLLDISTRSITASVAEHRHTTPLQMINDRTILEAKRLLKYSNLIIKEIAFTLGFEDPSYFVKFFKREVGMLPKEYRESRS